MCVFCFFRCCFFVVVVIAEQASVRAGDSGYGSGHRPKGWGAQRRQFRSSGKLLVEDAREIQRGGGRD